MISYKSGYKYQLVEPYVIQTPLRPSAIAANCYVQLDLDGLLHISRGYAWDGPSGPVPDVPSSMRGSLVHDALYQLMRTCGLWHGFKAYADEMLRAICIEDGMPVLCANAIYEGVHIFGSRYLEGSAENKVITAGVA